MLDFSAKTIQEHDVSGNALVKMPQTGKLHSWFMDIRPQLDKLLGQIGMSGLTSSREKPPLGKNGAFDIGSNHFRKACALLEDGTVLLVKAYNSPELTSELVRLRAQYDLPVEKIRKPASLADVAACYDIVSAQTRVEHSATRGQIRLQQILIEAAALGAADIKMIVHANHAILRIKVGSGEFDHGEQWQVEDARAAINWIYAHRDGGDGKATLVRGEPASFSIGQAAKLPGMPRGIGAFRGQIGWHGDIMLFITLRLLPLPDTKNQGNLKGLGLEDDVLRMLFDDRKTNTGLGILGGSTGDGKSTTLQRHMDRLYMEREGAISIYTIEDPIEYPATGNGVVQFPVKPGQSPEERKANFSKMLMVFVRTNPDVGMVSEIRSANDVNEVLQFVTSGHKVYTTVHANSAPGILFRLIALGVRPQELAGPDVVSFVMRQKLVPVLCKQCAEPLSGAAMQQVVDWLGNDDLFKIQDIRNASLFRRNRKGCSHCLSAYSNLSGAVAQTARNAWAGYSGRQATAEFIILDNTYRQFVADHDQLGATRHWLTPVADGGMGGIPIKTRLRHLVARGVTDYEKMTNETLPETVPVIAPPDRNVT